MQVPRKASLLDLIASIVVLLPLPRISFQKGPISF